MFDQNKYKFDLAPKNLKVALNNWYSPLDSNLKDGDTLVFIPPVAGG